MNDILEALVGDASDFYKDDFKLIEREDGTWMVDGHYSLHDFLTYFELDELINDYEVTTVSGLIMTELSHIPKEEFPAQTLALELYTEGGVRGIEIGALMADRDPVTRQNRHPDLETVRLAIPRRVYTDNHMNYVAATVGSVSEKRDRIKRGVKIGWEAPIMRHFTIRLERF